MDAGKVLRKTVAAYGGVAKPLKCLLLLITVFLIVSPVCAITIDEFTPYFNFESDSKYGQDVSHYNTTTQLAEKVSPNTVPWDLWVLSGLLSLGLFLYSLRPVRSVDELESSILVAVMSWVTSAYCAYGSFGVDRVVGFGTTSQIFNTTTKATASFYNHEYVYMENHLKYTFPEIGVIMTIFCFGSVAYTLYRVSRHRAILGQGVEA